MTAARRICVCAFPLVTPLAVLLVMLLAPVQAGYSMNDYPRRGAAPPALLGAASGIGEPIILTSAGDTTWVQVHSNPYECPGDPNLGHGGEATGGPGPAETWCFEEGAGDSCGTNPPWTANCFKHIDVRALPSPMDINYWHVDSYRTDQRAYCGSRALWCGSPAMWEGQAVECGTWANPPGYGEQWHCIVQLSLPPSFSVANGCTVLFDPRYDTECKYDYFYVDYWNGTAWKTLATFNATSNDPGGTCGGSATPDYFANSDVNRLTNCNWQARTDPNEPAFEMVITHASLIITSAPRFRWRFTSDASWDDADGNGNTDGAAYIDNVWISGDAGSFYAQDFEACEVFGALPEYWSLEDPPGVTDQWHISHDPDPPYEGGDGGSRTACLVDSSWVWRARPENGFPLGATWRNGWYYRLMSPRIPVMNSGCVVQYDQYYCINDYTCDWVNWKWRAYDSDYGKWCPWQQYDVGYLLPWCSYWWYPDDWDDLSPYYDGSADSIQVCWDILDYSMPWDVCRGKHAGTDFQVDNLSIGFFDAGATQFYARGYDLLHDTFFTDLCAYNSRFDVYDPDTVSHYSGGVEMPWEKQLIVSVLDPDGIDDLDLLASLDGGGTWVAAPMVFHQLSYAEDYAGTVCPADFGLTEWAAGTEVWYCVRATDNLANVEYFPARANPADPGHTGTRDDYLEFSILPFAPDSTAAPRILLVDGQARLNYDWAPCLSVVDRQVMLPEIYKQTLSDAGYCFDVYDISGAGYSPTCQPVDYGAYDAVVWFTGPLFSNSLFDGPAQAALRDYLGSGGKVVLLGDRIAYNMAIVGEDSLGGEFLAGVMGSTYLAEMESGWDKPFLYLNAVDTLTVLGAPVAVDLDSVLVYRECPYLRDLSYVVARAIPPSGYTAQPLLEVLNPGTTYQDCDGAVYVEYQNAGQCVYVNFDLCGMVNHTSGYCSGDAAGPAPDFATGVYEGRVDLVRVILEDIFGLPSDGGGQAGVPGPVAPARQWALSQNTPNPWTGRTEIAYEVAAPSRVSIRVYDVGGRLVRTLVNEHREPGRYSVAWDGAAGTGEWVASGVYFYKMEGAGFKATRKIVVVK